MTAPTVNPEMEMKQLKENLKAQNARVQAHKEVLAEVLNANTELKAGIKLFEQQVMEMQAKINELTQKNTVAENDKKALCDQKEALSKQLTELQENHTLLQQQYDDLRIAFNELWKEANPNADEPMAANGN